MRTYVIFAATIVTAAIGLGCNGSRDTAGSGPTGSSANGAQGSVAGLTAKEAAALDAACKGPFGSGNGVVTTPGTPPPGDPGGGVVTAPGSGGPVTTPGAPPAD